MIDTLDIASLLADTKVAGLQISTDYLAMPPGTVTPPAGTLRDSEGADIAGEFSLADGRQAVTIDSWGAQASRMEIAAERIAAATRFPLVRFLDQDGALLTTSVRLSHRHADATWRAAHQELTSSGIPFDTIQHATITTAEPLLRWFPTAILFGWWHSHIVKSKDAAKRQADLTKQLGAAGATALQGYAQLGPASRSARILTSEIMAAGVHRRVRMAARQDNLFGAIKTVGDGKTSITASNLGIGSMPPVRYAEGPVDVTYETISGEAFLSLTGLRRFTLAPPDQQADAQHLVVALGLLLFTTMHEDLSLRAGADLVVGSAGNRLRITRHGSDPEPIDLPAVSELTKTVMKLGKQFGWGGPVDVAIPAGSVLHKLLDKSVAETT